MHRSGQVCEEDIYKRASEHNDEQQGAGKLRNTQPHAYVPGNLQCLLGAHVGDIEGAACNGPAEPLLKHFHDKVGQCKADCNSFLHAGVQHECSSGVVFTHRHAYIDRVLLVDNNLFVGGR